jgi:hypothetical protein
LKPENLFVTGDGRVKILDFGLAKLKQPKFAGSVDTEAPTGVPHTDPGVVLGTVGYMAPEQVRGQEADHRADLFSFGAILYEMLTGQRAFGGGSVGEMMSAILKEEPPELAEINEKVPPQLERILRRCLEKRPEQRFQSASDLGFAGSVAYPVGRAAGQGSGIACGDGECGQGAAVRRCAAGVDRGGGDGSAGGLGLGGDLLPPRARRELRHLYVFAAAGEDQNHSQW